MFRILNLVSDDVFTGNLPARTRSYQKTKSKLLLVMTFADLITDGTIALNLL